MGRARSSIAAAGAAVLVTALAGGIAPTASAAPAAAPADCPAVVPTSGIQTGATGTGYTVVTGTTPQAFGVEVLGVMPDGIAPGRDLVMIKVYDLPGGHVIDQGGGIWEGMSGSPVYVDGKLLGAVSYGFTLAPSPIGGLTPAADMVEDLSAGSSARRLRTKVPLSSSERHALASRAQVATPRGSLGPIRTPLGVSGLRADRLARLQADLEGAGLPLTAHAAGRAVAPKAAPAARPVAGGNFVATVAYGDATLAGIGTTTWVCGDQALAFGHPFVSAGASTFGANDAYSLGVVEDATFGSFKQANIGALLGTVDQDRTVGVRARLGAAPPLTPVTTDVTNLDSKRERTGTTQVTDQSFLAEATAYGSWANLDRVFDESGDGRAWSSWTIQGTRAGGKPFSVHRSNRWASQDDATFDPGLDVALAVDSLVSNDFEPVTISSVDLDANLTSSFDQLHVVKVEVSVNGGKYQSPKTLKVKAGAKLTVRVRMRPYRSTETVTGVVNLRVPKDASGQVGSLSALGGVSASPDLESEDGGDSAGCLLDGDGCDNGQEGSLDAVIRSITSVPRNDDVLATLSFDSGDEDSGARAAKTPATVTAKSRQKLTVVGSRSLTVVVR